VVAACLGWVIVNYERFDRPAQEPPAPRIGIGFDQNPANTEARVHVVVPESPAVRAGVRVGDLVVSIDETPVSTNAQLREAIRAGTPGAPRNLTIRRGEELIHVSVVPELPQRKKVGLIEPRSGPENPPKTEWLSTALSFLPALGVGVIAALVSHFRRRAKMVVWRGFLLAMIGSVAAAAGVAYLCKTLAGGWSLGAILLALLAQMVALLALTAVANVWCGRTVPPPPDPIAPMSPLVAVLLGAFYLFTGFVRVSIVLVTLDMMLTGGETAARTDGLDRLAAMLPGTLGTLLFVAAVVVVGPLAEESLFRGFLLPRLAAQWNAAAGNLVSSLIFALFHPHYTLFMPIVFVYGWVFGWARLRTGGIVAPFILHMAVNGLVTVLMLART